MFGKLYFPVVQPKKYRYPKRYVVGYHFIGRNGKKYTTIQWKKRHNLRGRNLPKIRSVSGYFY